jgi:hypothetical protein
MAEGNTLDKLLLGGIAVLLAAVVFFGAVSAASAFATLNLWLLFWAALGVAYALTALALFAATYGAIALTAAMARWVAQHFRPGYRR